MKIVLDASVFFTDFPVGAGAYTTHSVVGELKDLRSKCRYESLLAEGLCVSEPSGESRLAVREAALAVGDESVLSPTDIDVVALALELGAAVASDDFAVQNVSQRLKIPVQPIQQRKAKPRKWKYRCSGCGRFYKSAGICDVCGSEIKRKLK